MNAEELIERSKFNIDKMLKIMNCIDHKWIIESEFRIPTKKEIINKIQFLIEKIKESHDFIYGIVDNKIASAIGGIHVNCTLSNKSIEEIEKDHIALNYRLEIKYIPFTNIVYE